jgi:hypothetical protein
MQYMDIRDRRGSHSSCSVLVLAWLLRFGVFRLGLRLSPALEGDLVAIGADTPTPWGTTSDGGINTLASQPLSVQCRERKKRKEV